MTFKKEINSDGFWTLCVCDCRFCILKTTVKHRHETMQFVTIKIPKQPSGVSVLNKPKHTTLSIGKNDKIALALKFLKNSRARKFKNM